MPQLDGHEKHNDLIDLIIQSSQKTVDVKNEDGTISREQQMDTDSLWWKTHTISSNQFGQYLILGFNSLPHSLQRLSSTIIF
jgi:hypothetical protein